VRLSVSNDGFGNAADADDLVGAGLDVFIAADADQNLGDRFSLYPFADF